MPEKKVSLARKIGVELYRARRRYIDPLLGQRKKVALTQAAQEALLRYKSNPLTTEPDTFLLVRVIGNDLEPRHRSGQSRENVEFMLRNEPAFPNTTKFWVVNRILDEAERARIVELLEQHRQEYAVIDFSLAEYAKIGWDFDKVPTGDFIFSDDYRDLDDRLRTKVDIALRRKKVAYAMNNNGARNFALNVRRGAFKWIMPWDGNCFLTTRAFDEIARAVKQRPELPYVIVPMVRMEDNSLLLDPWFSRKASEEPQIVFRSDAAEEFNATIPYGRRPKIDLLWRLRVPGKWDRYDVDPWDEPKPEPAEDGGLFHTAGWVARLDSGKPELEIGRSSSKMRAVSRDEAILATTDRLDRAISEIGLAERSNPLLFYDLDAVRSAAGDPDLSAALRRHADAALHRGPYSVVEKTAVPPSKNAHDYLNPAPYWWPDPKSRNGLPYIRRDGVRVPGTELFEARSEQFDRSRAQRMFDDTTVLALAWQALGDRNYADKAAVLLRTWFLDAGTRMTPHLSFAQVVGNEPSKKGYGILEFKDVYYLLDAVWMIEQSGALSEAERAGLRSWFASYADWLDKDPAARTAFRLGNNQGVYFEVQRYAIANYLGDALRMTASRMYARARMHGQLAADGSLPAETMRAMPRHYSLFTAQGWTTLARLLSATGDDLWHYNTTDGRSLKALFDWLLGYCKGGEQSEREELDPRRFLPILADMREHYGHDGQEVSAVSAEQTVLHPGAAVAPFWTLRRR